MDVFEAIQKRRSVRSYLPDEVPEEKIERILDAARLAPSAGNMQPWHFVIVRDAEKRRILSRGGVFAWFLSESPVVIAGCGNRKASPNWYTVDTAIAMQNMVLTATAEGLGTCWIGSFSENQVKRVLKIPEDYRVVSLLAVGYPKDDRSLIDHVSDLVDRKKDLRNIASLEEFGNPFDYNTES